MEINRSREKMWTTFIEEANEQTIWMIKKYIDKPRSLYYIPTINGASSNQGKTVEFTKTFFSVPPPANRSDIDSTMYPEPVASNPIITMNQLRWAINKISLKKAPGPDEIANITLKKTFSTTSCHLLALIQASVNLGHFLMAFKTTSMVILHKPGKPDYTRANAYHSIALENTLGKLIESIIMQLLSHTAEEYELLAPQHYGGRHGRMGEEVMIMLMERIKHAWKEGATYLSVFLDGAGAFNYVLHVRLIHNLKMRRVPRFIVRWVEHFLQGPSTRMRFNRAESEKIYMNAGVLQESSISPLLYMFYNTELLEIPENRSGMLSLGFIDDIVYGVQGQIAERNVKDLKVVLVKAESWRERHGARFKTSKYVLVHFKKMSPPNTTAEIHIGNTTIKPVTQVK